MSGQPAVLQVVILRDGLLVGTEVFVPGQYVLGSGEAAELKLDDPSVDENHATLYFQNGRVAVQDGGSRGGLFVNGHRVTACEVRPVDEIACGPFSLKVRVLAQKPAAKSAPPSADLAALIGQPGAPHHQAPHNQAPAAPAAGRGPPPPSTVVSPRRMAAAPATTPVPKQAPHLRAVPTAEFEALTDTVTVSDELDAPSPPPAIPLRPPAPPPPVAAAPATVAPPVAKAASVKATAPLKGHAPARATQPLGSQQPQARRHRAKGPSLPSANEGKGAPKLFFELYWVDARQHASSYQRIKQKKPVRGGLTDQAQVPLWGFNVPPTGFALAEQRGRSYRVYVPPHATVEKRGDDGHFHALPADQLESAGSRKCMTLSDGMAIRLTGEGDMSLVAYVQPAIPKPWVNPLKHAPWLALFFLGLFGAAFGWFVITHPPEAGADFKEKNLPPVAVRLIQPKPEEKKKIEKKVEELKKKPEKKIEAKKDETPKVVTKQPEVKKTMDAIKKISAAGPAMKDILAAVDKLGNGPGKKDAKNFKLSGLIGKAPIANAGLGTFGLGGGGQGGMGTKGLEVLRGKGGGGIGALGAGNIGKGAVGGTVSHAVARSISASGSIDKDAVAKVVNSHLQEVRACYERALLKEPGLAGKIVLEWGISTAGIVTSAKTKSSSMKNVAVEGCIMQSLKTWKFPPARGGNVIISYPFMFNSVGY